MADDDDHWLPTLGMIGLYRSGVAAVFPILREAAGTPDLSAAVADGRLPGRGRQLRRFLDYRVRSDHLIATFQKFRVEFNLRHPAAFSAYLLHRHIELNRTLRRMFPQYIGLPLARDLDELSRRGLVVSVDDTASLFELTSAGAARESEQRRSDRAT